MRAHGINWGALLYLALVALGTLLVAASWLYDKIRHVARKRREGRLTRTERREFRAARKAYGDKFGTMAVEWRAQAAEARARHRVAESGES